MSLLGRQAPASRALQAPTTRPRAVTPTHAARPRSHASLAAGSTSRPLSTPVTRSRVDAIRSMSGRRLRPIETDVKGAVLLNSARLNKGSAFSREERETFELDGMLPYAVHTLEEQLIRAKEQLDQLASPILQYQFLISMREQNQVLFYSLLARHLTKLLPIIYTPTVGQAIQEFSHRFRKPDGCFLSYPDRDNIEAVLLQHGGKDDVDLVVITDSEGILGIGDQGVGGILICVGKCALYTLGAGIDPNRVLPIVLDVGTDNESLLHDSLYFPRVRGREYDQYIQEVVKTCSRLFPDALLHFEDFGTANAQRILDRYQDEVSIFNDDIQGTGAVALAAITSAVFVKGEKLSDQRIVVHGAGTAGLGVAHRIAQGMVEVDGITFEEAAQRFYMIDRDGLLTQGMRNLRPGIEPFARPDDEVKDWERADADKPALRLIDVVKHAKPTVLIGTSTQARAFDERVIKEMAQHVKRPIVIPLSNPISLAEADPAKLAEWTDGQALVATGSPFPPIEREGRAYKVAQCNNALIYPGLGLGVIQARAKRLSDSMIVAGVHALAELSPALKDPKMPLLPDLGDVREASIKVASAVALAAKREGAATVDVPEDEAQRERQIRDAMWQPVYRPLVLRDPKHALGSAEYKTVPSARLETDVGGDGKTQHGQTA